MKHRLVRPLLALFLAWLLGLALALIWGASLDPTPAQAAGAAYYVDDDTCPDPGSGTEGDPFCHIQDAVDAASAGGEVRVASGTYTGTQMVVDSRTGYTYTQVVFVDKSLTLRGGYDATDWNATPDPVANPTVIDAQGHGRGISLVGKHRDTPEVTIDGFTITGGDYTDLGNPIGGGWQVCHEGEGVDCGGGLYATWSHFVLRNCVVRDNTAGSNDDSHGGGIYVYMIPSEGPGVRIENTAVLGNSAPAQRGQGGGMFADGIWQPITITHSAFQDNHAQDRGGGLKLYNNSDRAFIQDTDFISNTAFSGSGAHIPTSVDGEAVWIERTRFQNNQAGDSEATLCLEVSGPYQPQVWLSNLLFSGNRSRWGSIIDATNGNLTMDVHVAHVTAAGNATPTFLKATAAGSSANRWTRVTLTNTLLVSFTNGFAGLEWNTGEVEIQHSHTLAYEVTNLHHVLLGSPTFTAVHGVSGDSMLDATYHLQVGSAAIDTGMDAGVMDDLDNGFRPQGTAPDVGADEFDYPPTQPSALTISGPAAVPARVSGEFVASVSPVTATAPLTYVWEATDQSPVTHTHRTFSDSNSFTWDAPGDKVITVTAINAAGAASASHTVHVKNDPVLHVAKRGPAQALIGAPIIYTLTVTNSGLGEAESLVITDVLPAGASYISGGALVGDRVRWTIASLPANGGVASVSLVVTATETITNDTYWVAASGGHVATGTMPVVTVVGLPDLSIRKEGPYGAGVGDEVEYTLSVVNDGSIAATGLVITDVLPVGANYVGGGALVGGAIEWTFPHLPGDGGTTEVSFVVTAAQTLTNADYGVRADGGFRVIGDKAVVTIIGPAGARYVAPGGVDGLNNCTESSNPCATLQHAVNVSVAGDEIRVAAGAYSGAQMVVDSRTGYTYTQVVFVDKSLTLHGGYDATDWNATPDPVANPTVIDAQGHGRGISLVGKHPDTPEVTIDGFTITGGDYTDLGNPLGGGWQVCHEDEGVDCGGGLYATWSHFVLRNCVVRDNTAGSNDDSHGGGIYVYMIPSEGPGVRIENTAVISNSAPALGGQGGGMFADGIWQPITITHSAFQDNHAQDRGGGLKLYNNSDQAFIQDTDFISNTAFSGSGAHIPTSVDGEAVRIEGGRFQNNQAGNSEATLYLEVSGVHQPQVWLTNLLFSGNRSSSGSIIDATNGYLTMDVHVAHVTAAGNATPTFLKARAAGSSANRWTRVTLTNTLLVSFTNGFAGLESGTGEVEVHHSHTLAHEVTNLHHALLGSPTFTAADGVSGDSMLDATYHLKGSSAAIDAGVDAGVDYDIDGDARPVGSGFDIGADEFTFYKVYLPVVLR